LHTAIEDPPIDDIDAANARMATIAPYTRIILYWNDVAPNSRPANPTNPNSYTWTDSRANTQITRALANGLIPIVTVWRAPAWAERNRSQYPNSPTGTVDPNPQDFGDFAEALAQQYHGVKFWEAWNEPNGPHFLNPQYKSGTPYSPGIYRQLLNQFADGIHAIDSGDIVSTGGMAPAYKIPPLTFMRKLFCLSSTNKPVGGGCQAHLDAFSHHPYTNGGPFTKSGVPNAVWLGDLPSMRKVLVAAKKAGRIHTTNLWVTEFSWDTNGPDPLAVPLALHARWVSEALYQAYRSGASVFVWHQFRDRPFPQTVYQSGLYFCGQAAKDDDDTCGDNVIKVNDAEKAGSATSFRFPFVAYAKKGRVSIWGRTPDESAGSVAIQRKVNGQWKAVKPVSANVYGIFSASWPSSDTTHLYRASILSAGESSNAFSLHRPKPFSFKKTMWGCGGFIKC
jgi:hypothetical protein